MIPEDPDEGSLSHDPDEDLRLRNELLRIKLQAELGAEFAGDIDDLPPEIEHQFLQQVLAFQRHQESAETISVGQHIGREVWPKAETFAGTAALREAWEGLQRSLQRKHIQVDFLADYPLAVKWDFITQELMQHRSTMFSGLDDLMGAEEEVQRADRDAEGGQQEWSMEDSDDEDPDSGDGEASEDLPAGLAGGYVCFIYEEFHPNHARDIERQAHFTLRSFFENGIAESCPHLSNPLVSEAGEPVPCEVLAEKVASFHDLFAEIRDWSFEPDQTSWEMDKNEDGADSSGMGYVEGTILYTVVTDDGAESLVRGPFKAYAEYREGWWSVCSFHLHGFSWA